MSIVNRLCHQFGIRLPSRIRERRGIVDWDALPSMKYAEQLTLQFQTKDLKRTFKCTRVRSRAGLRAFAVGKRKRHVDIARAGLSQ